MTNDFLYPNYHLHNGISMPIPESPSKKITFPATIVVTKKNHWYITVPKAVKEMLVKERKKVVNVTLERIQ